MPFKPAPRLKTLDYIGVQRYFLTICTLTRRNTFLDGGAVNDATSQLRQTSIDECFAVIAYCFMPDHVHALVEGMNVSSDFQKYVRMYKQRTSFAWKRRTGLELWQRGYFDRVLRAEEDTFAVARYILQNPVRASLCRTAEGYPYSGSFTMAMTDLLDSSQMHRRT